MTRKRSLLILLALPILPGPLVYFGSAFGSLFLFHQVALRETGLSLSSYVDEDAILDAVFPKGSGDPNKMQELQNLLRDGTHLLESMLDADTVLQVDASTAWEAAGMRFNEFGRMSVDYPRGRLDFEMRSHAWVLTGVRFSPGERQPAAVAPVPGIPAGARHDEWIALAAVCADAIPAFAELAVPLVQAGMGMTPERFAGQRQLPQVIERRKLIQRQAETALDENFDYRCQRLLLDIGSKVIVAGQPGLLPEVLLAGLAASRACKTRFPAMSNDVDDLLEVLAARYPATMTEPLAERTVDVLARLHAWPQGSESEIRERCERMLRLLVERLAEGAAGR